MDASALETVVTLKNQKVLFEGVSATNPGRPVQIDYLPPAGDGEGFRGLELLLLAFGGCVSTCIVFLLRRSGKKVESYSMRAAGEKREKPLSLAKIRVEVELDSPDTSEAELAAFVETAKSLSPVWLAIAGNVQVEVAARVASAVA